MAVMLVAIAWRNLWRNTRRTVITLVAVAGGLASMLAMYAMMNAMRNRMMEGVTGSSTGHAQIHREGYRDRGGATRTVEDADLVLVATRRAEGVVAATGRIYGFSHAAIVRGSDEEVRSGGGEDVASPVVALYGVDAEHEGEVTDLPTKVTEGRWFEGEAEVIVGAGVAERHAVKLGDAFLPTAVDMSGAMRGPWAVSDDVPRIVGIVRAGVEQVDGRMVIIPRSYLEKLLRMEDQVHEIAIRGEDAEKLDELVASVRESVARARSEAVEGVTVQASLPLVVQREAAEEAPAGDGGVATDAGSAEGDGGGAPAEITLRLVAAEPGGDGEERPEGLEGRYLDRAEDLVLSRRIATDLGVSVDDRVVVAVPIDCGEDVPAEECPPSAEPFVVAGIVDEAELLDGRFALVSSQVLAGNIASLAPESVAALEEGDREAAAGLAARLRGEVAAPDEVLSWKELSPMMAQMLAMFDIAPLIFFIIIFFAVMLGIVNTMLMATFERTRELGLMRAVGMRPGKVVSMVMWEAVLLGVVGVVAGLALGMPLVWYWIENGMNMGVFMTEDVTWDMEGVSFDPVMWPTIHVMDVVRSVLVVGIMTSLSGLWPAVRAARLQPTEALRHE